MQKIKHIAYFLILIPLIGCRTLGSLPADVIVEALNNADKFSTERKREDNVYEIARNVEKSKDQTYEEARSAPSGSTVSPSIYSLDHAQSPIENKVNESSPAVSEESDSPELFVLRFSRETMRYAAKTVIVAEEPKNCKFVRPVKTLVRTTNEKNVKDYIRNYAADHYANTVYQLMIDIDKPNSLVEAQLYNCPERPVKPQKNHVQNGDETTEFDLFFGFYVDRNGFLKHLGETGPTIGFTYQNFGTNNAFDITGLVLGWHLHFNLDHFFNTESTFLQPQFINQDFTNYLWSIGPAFKYVVNKDFQINYNLGLGINFLEIDTNYTNDELTDEEATRTTISLVHQVGFFKHLDSKTNYRTKEKTDFFFGFNFLYYWMPNPLGKFANDSLRVESYGGGSYAIMANFKWLTY